MAAAMVRINHSSRFGRQSRCIMPCLGGTLFSAMAVMIGVGRSFTGFTSSMSNYSASGTTQRRMLATSLAALDRGNSVLVWGRGGPSECIVVSMLKEMGLKPRPVTTKKGAEAWKDYNDVEGYIFNPAVPMPVVEGLAFVNEDKLDVPIATAFIRKLATTGLKRVVLLSNPQLGGGIFGVVQSGGFVADEARDAAEAAVKTVCEGAGVEWTVLRTGALRGGGPGTGNKHAMKKDFYEIAAISDDITGSIDEELWDYENRGLKTGDVEGGLFRVTPWTGRVVTAVALTNSLTLHAAANKQIEMSSEKTKVDPTAAEYDAIFQ